MLPFFHIFFSTGIVGLSYMALLGFGLRAGSGTTSL